MKRSQFKSLRTLAFVIGLTISTVVPLALAQSTFPPSHQGGRNGMNTDFDAYEIFYTMYDQSIDLKARELYVVGSDRSVPVTFGSEKEGSSAKILRVMSPDKYELANYLLADPVGGVEIIRAFLSGEIREKNVFDKDGQKVILNEQVLSDVSKIDLAPFQDLKNTIYRTNYGSFNVVFEEDPEKGQQFQKAIHLFISAFQKAPFSFFKMAARQQIFKKMAADGKPALPKAYADWEPLYGDPQKYIQKGYKELNKGWEVIFEPQQTYADFEKQTAWFRQIMGSKTQLFEAPGHQRVVMPSVQLAPWQEKQFKQKAGELNRMLQAYLLLRGLKGQTGILGAAHKYLIGDKNFEDYVTTGKGPIKIEKDRFYQNSIGIEFRTGMKDEMVRRFVQAVYASRFATNQMGDLADISSWELLPGAKIFDAKLPSATKLGVNPELYNLALANFAKLSGQHDLSIDSNYLVPLWSWENAPFLQGKIAEIKRLRVDFLNALANMDSPTNAKVSKLLSDWVKASNLINDIEKYMAPKKSFDRVTSPLTVAIKPGDIDVNKIDLGNEFTARMPLTLKAEYDGTGQWTQTIYDMTPTEREQRIRNVAESLKESFTGSRDGVTSFKNGAHGHDLSIAYEFNDQLNRSWRVEWDGVGRNYTEEGQIVDGSARGGHIEIVSPKYNPTLAEIQKVYAVMDRESLIPDYKMGGSHINVDFEPLENNPKAVARFLALFHQHRGIISFMFQHVNRLRAAEPVEVSARLNAALKDFNGSKEDLAKILYNEKYYNQRLSRKTRYTQIDVSNYMGQAIPSEFVKPDFDVVKARFTGGDGWSRQFRVTKQKKLEMRLFDAPKDALEAALQIKVVRALLNKALNTTDPLLGSVQAVNHEAYVKNPEQAYQDLQALARDLGLEYVDYSPYITNKVVINKSFMSNRFYENWFKRADREFPKQDGWKSAINKVRTGAEVLYSDRFILDTQALQLTVKPSAAQLKASCKGLF